MTQTIRIKQPDRRLIATSMLTCVMAVAVFVAPVHFAHLFKYLPTVAAVRA